MTRSAVLDQPALWDVPRPAPARPAAAAATPKHRPTHTPRPRRSKESQAEECDPTCLACGKPEGRGLCYPRCSVVCVHTAQPDVVEVCLTTVRVTARLVAGVPGVPGIPGRKLAVVVECPFCERLHWHTPAFGRHHRVSGCGQPYIVTLPRPRITPPGAPQSTQAGEQGAVGQEGHPSTFNASQAATATRGAAAARAAISPGRNEPPYIVQADTPENTQ